MTDEKTLADLHAPLGQPGSGRVRYGAAMALHRDGKLPEQALEAYRICSQLDRQDPAPLLAERGAALPAPPELTAPAALRRLLDEAADYLTGLAGPGVGDVLAGIARFGAGPGMPRGGGLNAICKAWLPAALAELAATHASLAKAIADGAPHLEWITYDLYPREEIGEAFADGHAYATILGEGAPFAAEDFDFGLFLIAPHVLYRDHCHRAPELYAPLTGPHGWRFGPHRQLIIKPAHEPVWNDPYAPHMTKCGPSPFLCFFGWPRDVSEAARVLPADDWAALEILRLGGAS